MTADPILAIDLRNYKSVVYPYDRSVLGGAEAKPEATLC
jgi:hypothetical protein